MNDDLLNKCPPHDIDAEEAVLSSIFISGKNFERVGSLKPEDFYKGAHKKIFSAMVVIDKKKEPIDLITVSSELDKMGHLESIGGRAYLSTIANEAPVATNIYSYSKIIQDNSRARELIDISSGIITDGFSVTDIEAYISDSQAKILQVQTTTSKDKIYEMDSLMHSAIDRITAAQESERPMGFKFGMPTIDNFMNLFGSKLFLIAARPGMGKTAFMLSVALFLAFRGTKVGILSIEMDKEEISDRLLSVEANVNTLLFYNNRKLHRNEVERLNNAAGLLSTLPIFIDDAGCKIQDVERKCRKLKKKGCEIIFIDQLSKIKGLPGQSKFDIYTDNCSSIALLKKELRIPIGLLCQLNRKVEERADKTPMMSDLKQTGMLEEDADLIFFIYRPGYYDDNIDESITDIILAKNRQGAKGKEQYVLFNKKRGMFTMVP